MTIHAGPRDKSLASDKYEARIRNLEEGVRLLLARTTPASLSLVPSAPLVGAFRYSIERGLEPLVSESTARFLRSSACYTVHISATCRLLSSRPRQPVMTPSSSSSSSTHIQPAVLPSNRCPSAPATSDGGSSASSKLSWPTPSALCARNTPTNSAGKQRSLDLLNTSHQHGRTAEPLLPLQLRLPAIPSQSTGPPTTQSRSRSPRSRPSSRSTTPATSPALPYAPSPRPAPPSRSSRRPPTTAEQTSASPDSSTHSIPFNQACHTPIISLAQLQHFVETILPLFPCPIMLSLPSLLPWINVDPTTGLQPTILPKKLDRKVQAAAGAGQHAGPRLAWIAPPLGCLLNAIRSTSCDARANCSDARFTQQSRTITSATTTATI
ncbi:hypothetical protein PTTG_28150 [Puccinia triticina 1-1 BBBD Race 1]|uniref:Uncharacterized protein n=1 Tax=Puccinia triticina (isolate 1-1 / race 1 (BBBD)) TaxID=630390 RepID=A0A180GDX1_PUCT1|nr:hypothetical protein PTTG_28150 [Puccinia triticina 1-1 BBBD Race 1]